MQHLEGFYRAAQGHPGGRTGGVTFVQRFGSSLNLNPHLHVLMMDGVYVRHPDTGTPTFVAVAPPTDAQLQQLIQAAAEQLIAVLERRGIFDDSQPDPLADEAPMLAWEAYRPSVPELGVDIAPPSREELSTAVADQYGQLQEMVDTYIEKTFVYPLQVEPDNSPLRMQLLKMYLVLRQIDTAIETGLNYLLNEQGDQGATCNNLGNAYFLKGDLTQAALYYKQAAALCPDDKGIQANLDRALRALGRAEAMDTTAGAGTKGNVLEEDVDSFYWLE